MGEFVFSDFYDFLSRYSGPLKLVDRETGELLYRSNTDGAELPSDYADCEVGISYIKDGALVIEVNYTFHEIQE